MKPRIFTVAEANRQIPTVQRVMSRLEEWQPRLEECQRLMAESGEMGPLDAGQRVRLSHDLERAEHEVLTAAKDLEEIGCVLKQGGLVDFFTVKDGILYELCWRQGEDEILFYHEFGVGFQGRTPLTHEDIARMGNGFQVLNR